MSLSSSATKRRTNASSTRPCVSWISTKLREPASATLGERTMAAQMTSPTAYRRSVSVVRCALVAGPGGSVGGSVVRLARLRLAWLRLASFALRVRAAGTLVGSGLVPVLVGLGSGLGRDV